MFKKGKGQKPVSSEWHYHREEARRTAFSLAEFSPQEINDYDLESAGVTGKFNDQSYTWERPLWPTRRHDIRDDPTR